MNDKKDKKRASVKVAPTYMPAIWVFVGATFTVALFYFMQMNFITVDFLRPPQYLTHYRPKFLPPFVYGVVF